MSVLWGHERVHLHTRVRADVSAGHGLDREPRAVELTDRPLAGIEQVAVHGTVIAELDRLARRAGRRDEPPVRAEEANRASPGVELRRGAGSSAGGGEPDRTGCQHKAALQDAAATMAVRLELGHG